MADDVLSLIDELDDLVHQARGVPLSEQVRLERDDLYELLDRLRETVPEELKHARWLVRERHALLAEARRECDRLLAEARDDAAEKTSERSVTRMAERQADEILARARSEAEQIRGEVELWADEILRSLELNLGKFRDGIVRGRQRLHERSS